MNSLRADFRTAVLGAFAGLFTFSFFLLADRVGVYYDYLACLELNNYADCPESVARLWWLPFALWHVLLFVLAAFVAHRYFAALRDSPFLLWQLVCVFALLAWAMSVSTVFVTGALMRGAEFDYDQLRGIDFQHVAKFLAAVFAANTLCASFLHSAARQYAPESGQRAA